MKRRVLAIAAACLSFALISAGASADPAPAASAPEASTNSAPTSSAGPPANSTPATALAPVPAAAPTSPTAPAAGQAAASNAVVMYIDPAITNRKWSNQSYLFRPTYLTGDLNNVGKEVTRRMTEMVTSISPDATVVTSPAPDGGARFYVVPTIKRLEQIGGMFAWDDVSYVMELEWRVTDSHGAVVLLDTVTGEAKGKFGLAARNASGIENSMLDNAMDRSRALLKPALADRPSPGGGGSPTSGATAAAGAGRAEGSSQ